ncbi:hypothetical protein EDD99_6522 [Streptomyces sp. 846.5]|nr:hypothetical protein [Streptomyces sp. 846.5]TDT98295.1 hypothetical protein EDD99_6522 [Streptomyces sp. 846.5]
MARWNSFWKTALTLAAAGALALGVQADAQASTGTDQVRGDTWSYNCEFQLLATWDGLGDDYAAAKIINWGYDAPGEDCQGWLQRYHNGSWTTVSGIHDVVNTASGGTYSQQTYNYWDGSGYLARACGQLINNSGVAQGVVCTASW